MKMTFHGHRPACLRAVGVDPAQPTGPSASSTGQSVKKINLGIFKIKIHRQTALQASLIAAVANPPADEASQLVMASRRVDEPALSVHGTDLMSARTASSAPPAQRTRSDLVAHWNDWAQASGAPGENRQAAVRIMTDWLECNSQAVEPSPLRLRHLGLTGLPDLPQGLESLDLADNQFRQVPLNLPESLKSLCAICNDIDRPPENLPTGLTDLDLAFNLLTRFPEHLPDSLQRLELGYNHLTDVPETLPRLGGADGYLDLDSNPLSDHEIARLNALTSAPSYEGPRIFFSMLPDLQAEAPARPLHESVLAWPQPPGVNTDATARLWQGFANEPGGATFSQFLDRLRSTVNFSNPQFQRNVADWLTQLEGHPDLRRDTFVISEGATTSCEDRVSLTFNAMRQLRLACDVARGDFDQRLPELLTLARGMFRLDQLEVIAREKAASLRFVDEIEVYLAYQVKLREDLALPLDTPDMRFFEVSYVSLDNLTDATTRVKAAELERFPDYLANQWQPWQSVLQRLAPERHAQAQAQLIDAMENKFDARLQARLQALGLSNDSDAQRQVGPQVQADIAREINGALTRDFLERCGLLSQIEPHWATRYATSFG